MELKPREKGRVISTLVFFLSKLGRTLMTGVMVPVHQCWSDLGEISRFDRGNA